MTQIVLVAGIKTKKGVQNAIAVWQVEKINWSLLDPEDEEIPFDSVPCRLRDFSFSNKQGSFRYVPLPLDRWTFWERLRFLFTKRL